MSTAFALALLLAATCHGDDSVPLRVSWGPHNAPPYAMAQDGELVGGLVRDIGVQAAKRLGTTAKFVNVPRARYESQLRDGTIDMTCIVNRDWLADPGSLTWTRPLFDEVDIVAQRAVDAPWLKQPDLRGKRIGTILGYRYPTLEPLFAQDGGNVPAQRDNAVDLDSNMQRLLLGRIDGVVDANIPMYYWLLRNDRARALRIAPLVVSSHPVSCVISPRAGPGATRIRKVVDTMIRKGVVRDLLAAYLVRD